MLYKFLTEHILGINLINEYHFFIKNIFIFKGSYFNQIWAVLNFKIFIYYICSK